MHRSKKALPNLRCRRHAGFTLVEMLVVLAIVALLAAITAGVFALVIGTQRSSTTIATIQTLTKVLNRQWSAVVAKASQEDIPPPVLAMAAQPGGGANDLRRARIIWIKLRLKQEFPMNFTEALAPGAVVWNLPPYSVTPYSLPSYLPAKQSYVNILTQAGVTASQNPYYDSDPKGWPAESAACLLMALEQGRGGITFSADSLPPTAVATVPGATGLRMFVDGWGNPLVFSRWAAANSDLDSSCPSGPSTVFRDPLDPEGLLQDPNWNNGNTTGASVTWYANWPGAPNYPQGVWWFEQYCHPVHGPLTSATNYTWASTYGAGQSYYMVPVITSAGRNGQLGLVQPPQMTYWGPNVTLTSPLLPDLMTIDLSQPEAANDNIHNYTLRQEARGE